MPSELLPPPRRWSLSHRPQFLEAYPVLSIGAAHRESRIGRDHVIWRDRHGVVTGAAQATWVSTSELVLRYRIEERDYYEARDGEVRFDIVWKGSQENNQRPFAACPRCGRHVDTLSHVDEWLCGGANRHGLRHRSAAVSKEVRWAEALAEIEGQLAVDEALGISGRGYQDRLAQRDALREKLGHRIAHANALMLARVTAEWVRPLPPASAS